jgi:hypothetical protein
MQYGGNGQRKRPGQSGPDDAYPRGTALKSKKWPGVGRAREFPGELAGAGGTELAAARAAGLGKRSEVPRRAAFAAITRLQIAG